MTRDRAGTRMRGDREFWREVLLSGAATAVPRWVLHPVPGLASQRTLVPDPVGEELLRLAAALGVPLGSLALAAHGKVLAALSGQHEVLTGYRAGAGPAALPCRLSTGPVTWRDLLVEAHRAGAEVVAHAGFPLPALARELGAPEPYYETVVDTAGPGSVVTGAAVLGVGIAVRPGGLTLGVTYRTDAYDAEAAARIAGYHVTALELMADHPDGPHRRDNLLSDRERRFQVDGLAGPRRKLPDRRVHELFEERARLHPDAVAAVQGTQRLTYRELNARANRIGRALLTHGLHAEGVVAVVTERNLDWMAAVLGVFKAGGTYLPIEPHFPAHRIAAMLSRAQCRTVLVEPGSEASLDRALESLSGVTRLEIPAQLAQQAAGDDLGVDVGPDHLAYLYFTSGSTGEPKGAMCEHEGFLNHVSAKIHDLEIRSDQVVAQTAPQCFDISLWQLVAALLVGGRTLLVEQKHILEVDKFLDTIIEGRAAVVQVVPSYLEVVLSHLERNPRELPDLRLVCVTGEALKPELARRWFAAMPAVGLVNAYGLTETCDDTNHEILLGPPAEGHRVPLGRPVQNVRVLIVDDGLTLVPLGAPGEIVFSGVCVGRGYVNDSERTRQAFVADPHRPGERLYRGGDYGHWRPDGKLEFLGRRDQQVKVRGFRVELAEVEHALARLPGVRDCAVVVAGSTDQEAHLVGFYTAARTLDPDLLREGLAAALPGYMVPSLLHHREDLPLTGNGKVDRKALAALAEELEAGERHRVPPRSASEERIAAAWATVLGVPVHQIGRFDNFFDLGGTSLSAVKLAILLDRTVSLKDLVLHPVLADLAGLVDGAPDRRPGPVGPAPPAAGRSR